MRTPNRQKVKSSSKDFFENGMRGHNAVNRITDLGNNIYLITRTNDRPELRILVADIYIVGEADVIEIDPNLLGVDGIVLIGFYNKYSSAAKELTKEMNVGLFDNREFFGAVNCRDYAFINYVKKEDK